ncbi:MAG: hypothetical protein AAGB24_08610 [Bacteroidota bacterium]
MKKFALTLFFALPLVMMGQELKSGKKFTNTVVLENAPEAIWAAITDYSNFKFWDEGIVDVKCSGELKKRQNCQVITSNGKIIEVEIVALVENESYTLRYKLSSGNMYVQRHLTSDDQSALSETVWYKGISQKTFEKYKGEDYGGYLERRLSRFKDFMEGKSREGR